MGLALQVLITGTATGIVYGIIAICVALIYRLSGVVHFAIGEIASLGLFVTVLVMGGLGTSGTPSATRFVVAAIVSIAVSMLASFFVYIVGVRPALDRESTVGWIAGTVAAAVFITGGIRVAFTRSSYLIRDPIPFDRWVKGGVIDLPGGASIQIRDVFVAISGLILASLAAWLLQRTRTGRSLRAITQDRVGAALVGVAIERSLLLVFALSGLLISVAVLIALPGEPVSIETGTVLGVKGLAVAAAARFQLPRPVLLLGIALGVAETAIATWTPSTLSGPGLSQIVPLLVALVLLAVRSRSMEVAETA